VRRGVWSLLHLRPGGFPWLVIAEKRLHRWVVIQVWMPNQQHATAGRLPWPPS